MRNRTRRTAVVFEACESRQHMAADLIVGSISSDRPVTPMPWAGSMNLTATVINIGNTAVSSDTTYAVTAYYVDNLYGTPVALDQHWISGADVYVPKTLHFNVPIERPVDNDGYYFVAVDTSNAVAESNESNNSYRGIGMDILRVSAEADVTTPAGGIAARPLNLDGNFVSGFIGDEAIGEADIDTYKVALQAGHPYWFEMRDFDSLNHLDGAIRLVDDQFQTVATSSGDTNQGGHGGYIEFTAPRSGDYFLAVSNQTNVGGSVYTLDNRDPDHGGYGGYTVAAAEIDRPDVLITSYDPTAIEGSPNDARTGLEFTVRRQWVSQPWRPTVVKLNWSGAFNGDLQGDLPATITIPANEYAVTFKAMPTQDGVNEPTETETVTIADDAAYHTVAGYTSQTLTIFDNPATHHPFMTSAGYIGGDRSGPRTFIGFDEDVGYSITRDDYVLRNLDTNAIIPAANYQVLWSPTIDASIVYFTAYPNGQLPDGNYRMTLGKNGVYTWPDGKTLADNVTIDFASLNGDTNADRKVDFTDLLTLAKNYNHDLAGDGGGHVGDFDRDGNVTFSDLLILAKNYGKQLAVPVATAAFAPATATATTVGRRTAASIFGDAAVA